MNLSSYAHHPIVIANNEAIKTKLEYPHTRQQRILELTDMAQKHQSGEGVFHYAMGELTRVNAMFDAEYFNEITLRQSRKDVIEYYRNRRGKLFDIINPIYEKMCETKLPIGHSRTERINELKLIHAQSNDLNYVTYLFGKINVLEMVDDETYGYLQKNLAEVDAKIKILEEVDRIKKIWEQQFLAMSRLIEKGYISKRQFDIACEVNWKLNYRSATVEQRDIDNANATIKLVEQAMTLLMEDTFRPRK